VSYFTDFTFIISHVLLFQYYVSITTVISFYCSTRMHIADYAVARCLSVRPSVRLSVTRRYCV